MQQLDKVPTGLRYTTNFQVKPMLKVSEIIYSRGLSQERHLAASLQHEDPTNPTYESTAAMYNRVVDEFLRHVQTRPGGVEVMFASHNEATVGHVLRRLVLPFRGLVVA